jgi:hypothetical protein
VPEAKADSQGLEKQEKVYPLRSQSPSFVALATMLLILFIIGAVLWNAYAYEFAELMRGKPEAPPGSLFHAAEVQDIEDLADLFRIGSLVLMALWSLALLSVAIFTSTGRVIRKVALSDAGVALERWGLGPWGRPIVIRTISEMKEVSRGRALKLAGVTPEGQKVTKQLSKLDIGGKRWEEFKNDLQHHIAPTEKG